jgi:hypothetical protein
VSAIFSKLLFFLKYTCSDKSDAGITGNTNEVLKLFQEEDCYSLTFLCKADSVVFKVYDFQSITNDGVIVNN